MKNIYKLLVLVFLFSCELKQNENLLSKNEMVPVMVDLYVATEMVSMARLPIDSAAIYFKSVYKVEVLNKYNIESTLFDDSFKYYSSRPEDFVWIQTAVADTLRVKHLLGRVDF